MRIFLTGIPGTDSKKQLGELIKFARKRNKAIEVKTVSEFAFKFAKAVGYEIVNENVLGTLPAIHDLMRGGAFKDILKDISEGIKSKETSRKHFIIDSHASLLRGGVVDLLRDDSFINDIDPDLFVTIIDAPDVILRRLETKKYPIWRERNLSVDDIMNWQNQEVNYTAIWAMAKKKPHYIIHHDRLVEMLYRFIFHPEMELVYASYPITNADPEVAARTQTFIKRLKRYFNVIEPIEVAIKDLAAKDKPAIFSHTVYSDLRWWVDEAKKVVAFLPKRIYSSGMNSEMLWAKMHTKTVWLVSPEDSPFNTYFVAHKVFKTENDLFKYLKKEGYKEYKNI